ncbi:unnamed protein product [Amoebophrya sp. A120]|nr:unnamed protein product [Amoebophrya sp. A120]|eukprot:GSA120T00016532001.1
MGGQDMKVSAAVVGHMDGSGGGPAVSEKVGRQQFEDARFQIAQEMKMKLVNRVYSKSAKMDFYFGMLILTNLVVLGFEADLSDKSKTGPENPFWWIESIILILFIWELSIRLRLHSPTLVTIHPLNAHEFNASLGGTKADLDEVMEGGGGISPANTNASNQTNDSKRPHMQPYAKAISFMESSDSLADEEDIDYVVVKYEPWTIRFCLSWVHQYMGTEHFGHFAWLVFDFFLVIVSILDAWVLQLVMSGEGFANVSAFRILRLIRVFRTVKLIRYYPDLWLLVNGLGQSLRALSWVMLLLLLAVYVSALFLAEQIRDNEFYMGPDGTRHPDPMYHDVHEYFSSVPMAMLTLFQIVTLENWPDIVRTMMEETFWYGIFFVLFIVGTNFMIMNLFVGVLVEYIQSAANTAEVELMKLVTKDKNRMCEELKEIFAMVDVDNSGSLSAEEFKEAIVTQPEVKRKISNLRVEDDELDWLFEVLDADGSGQLSIDEFVNGVLRTRDSELACSLMTMQNLILREFGKMDCHPRSKFYKGDNVPSHGFGPKPPSASNLLMVNHAPAAPGSSRGQNPDSHTPRRQDSKGSGATPTQAGATGGGA